MKGGNLSNVPAPSVYLDGASLFFKSKFGASPKLLYIKKITRLLREANVIVYFEKRARPNSKKFKDSVFPYTEIVEMSRDKFKRFLKKNRINLFVSGDRAKYFQGQCYLIEATANEILNHIYSENE